MPEQETSGEDLPAASLGTVVLVMPKGPGNRIIRGVVQELHYSVEMCDDGEEALQIIREKRPRAVILSESLSGVSAADLFRRVRRSRKLKDLPFLFVGPEGRIPGLREGHHSGLVKVPEPVDPEALKNHLEELLGLSQPGKKEKSLEAYLEEFHKMEPSATREAPQPQESMEAIFRQFLGPRGEASAEGEPGIEPVAAPLAESGEEPKSREAKVESFTEESWRLPVPEKEPPRGVEDSLYDSVQAYVMDSIRRAEQGDPPEIAAGRRIVDSMISSIDSEPRLLLAATDRTQEFALSAHCVNTAILALRISRTLEYEPQRRELIGLAALLHEIGVVKLPRNLIHKGGRLKTSEVEALRRRPLYAARMLEEWGSDYQPLSRVVAQVFERDDGSGYPDGLTGKQIQEESKVLAIADVFEACLHARPYRRTLTGYQAVQELTGERAAEFSDRIVKALLRSFSLYPYNEYVLLNSGEIGKVIDIHEGNLFRPTIQIEFNRAGEPLTPPRTVDLIDNPSLYVTKAIEVETLADYLAG